MIVCLMLVKNVVLVLQKGKEAKTRVNWKGKKDGSKNKIVFLIGIRTLKTQSCLGTRLHARSKVARFIPVTIWVFCFIDKEWNHSLEQKLTFIRIYLLWQFLSSHPCLGLLLLWNTNAFFQISIKNSITYPKHSQSNFLTGTQMEVV